MFSSFFIAGFECTTGFNRHGQWIDQIAATRHDVQIDEDYRLLRKAGIRAAREGIRSVLAVPVRLKDRVLGVMRVYSAQPRHYGAVATDFLLSVASLVALAIENADLYAALEQRYEDLKLDVAEWRRFLALG